jgi:hypothetical protein
MLQPKLLFKINPRYSKLRKRILNSTMLAEEEGSTATSLGRLQGAINSLIHRVPSVEGSTATSLGNLTLGQKYIKINRKNAPVGLFICFNQKTGE